ncbi:hypothetical protein [Rhizobium sp. CC-YZS058]|uniref:hypothetical protein n=1 Tax=Rhizobium sp. CC-YZS058 TaxID=3042153 RepID=UPI002B05D9F3|nr:hypothetical protein [Rhizobium sp. CC-YZS058]MEA3534547.1 hypothetical protein [Rhizobium sp. CC-YZS058]
MSPSPKRSPPLRVPPQDEREGLSIRIEQMAARFYPCQTAVQALAARVQSEILLSKTHPIRRDEQDAAELHHTLLTVMQRIVREERSTGGER